MKKDEIEEAESLALKQMDEWLDVTGIIDKDTGYYYELEDLIKESVHIGIQKSLGLNIEKDEFGNVLKNQGYY